MDWIALPPLASLRAFAVASRHLSFSAAGRELNVTHAAIAQQVRALEDRLGIPLVHREGRGIALTDDGIRLANGLNDGFAGIAAAVDAVREDRETRPLQVTMTQAFAKNWLVPRLGTFWEKHPDVSVALCPDDGLVDLVRDGLDVAIRFGTGGWPGVESEMLVPADYVIAGAKRIVGDGLTIEQMKTMRWVLRAGWPEQHLWLRSIGLNSAELNAREMSSWALSEVAMERGLGLTVTLGPLVRDAVEAGTIAIAYSEPTQGLGYHIVTRKGPRTAALRSFIRWLKSAV